MDFIKIFDEKIASKLLECGFSYVKETINTNQTIFCFNKTPELMVKIQELSCDDGKFSSTKVISDKVLFV